MRNWRVLTAVVAVILAVVAAVLAYTYLDEADERAEEDVEPIPVLRAAAEIPKGTTGDVALDNDLIEEADVQRDAVPENAITDPDDLRGRVASAVVSEKQFITSDTFVEPTAIEGFSGSIEEQKHAVSISVDDTRGVGGFLVPNDTVNVLVTTEVETIANPSDVDVPPLSTSAYLIPGVKVLAVGETTATSRPSDEEGEEPVRIETGLITLEVTSRQALQIAHAQNGNGQIYLALNPTSFDVDEFQIPAEIVGVENWFDQPLAELDRIRQEIIAAG